MNLLTWLIWRWLGSQRNPFSSGKKKKKKFRGPNSVFMNLLSAQPILYIITELYRGVECCSSEELIQNHYDKPQFSAVEFFIPMLFVWTPGWQLVWSLIGISCRCIYVSESEMTHSADPFLLLESVSTLEKCRTHCFGWVPRHWRCSWLIDRLGEGKWDMYMFWHWKQNG